MPKPTPLSPEIRQRVAEDIRGGHGRNEIARRHGISCGSVTNIARSEGLSFANDWITTTATEAHRADAAIARVQREGELLGEYLSLTTTTRRDGRETKRARRLSYQLYNLKRHHSR